MVARTREQNISAPSNSANGSEAIKVAMADDHAVFRDGLRRLLALEPDFKIVAEAKDGTEVLPLLEEHQPDILLLDLRMPGADGLTVLQRIQSKKLKTKIIVVTASEDEGEYVQAIKYGASGIVLKQTATELLIKSIRKVHEGETWLDSRPRPPP
jgi:DNA-binding NarL/FixJ family response regulator